MIHTAKNIINKVLLFTAFSTALSFGLAGSASSQVSADDVDGVEYSDAGRLDGIDYYNEHSYIEEDPFNRGLIARYSDGTDTLTLSNISGSESIDLTLNDDRDGAFSTYKFDENANTEDLPPGLRECFGNNFSDYTDRPDTNNIKARQPSLGDTDLSNAQATVPGGRYLLFECVGLNGGANGPRGNLYVTTQNGISIDPDDSGSVGNPSNDWTWVDYSGTAYNMSPGAATFPSADRFRFISPFEIIDRNETYPGTDKNVIYAAVRGEAFDNDGSLRLIEDGIAFYWPLKEEAILDSRYSEDDYDWQLPNDGVCRSGFVVRTKSSNGDLNPFGGSDGQGNYGKIRAVLTRTITSSTNLFGHDCIAVNATSVDNDGDFEFNQVSYVPTGMYGFLKEDALNANSDLDFSNTCSGCPPTLLSNRFYSGTFNARFLYSQFYWDIDGVGDQAQSVIRPYSKNNENRALKPYTGDPADPNSYNRLLNTLITEAPNHPVLTRLGNISLQADNTVLYTTDECIADGLRSFLVINRNPDAEGLDDSTMTDATLPHTQALIYTLGSDGGYTLGWPRGGDALECLGVEGVESNAAEILFDWVEGVGNGNLLPDVNDDPVKDDARRGGYAATAFIAYPSRSTLGENNPQSGRAGPEEVIVDGSAEVDPTCETNEDNPLSWLGCALLETADDIIAWIDGSLFGLLAVTEADYETGGEDSGFRQAWSSIRNIATVSILATGLFMIIATALDVGLFSNYTVKKYLPRIAISIIALQLSWVLGTAFIDLVNALAGGLEALLYYPFAGARDLDLAEIFGNTSESSTSSGVLFSAGAGIGAVALASMGLFGVLSIAYTVVIALLTAFVVLVFRKMAIILFLVISPLAIAAWVLPGNDDLWKKWRTTFVALLLVHPILALAIATGKIFAWIAVTSNGGAVENVTAWVIGIVAYIGGYFAIPFLLKASFGALSNITGIVNDKSKGFLDKGKNNLTGKRDQQKQWAKDRKLEDSRMRIAQGKGRAWDSARTGTLGAGLGKRKAATLQSLKDREQGYKDKSQREITEEGLGVLDAREAGKHSLTKARLNTEKAAMSNKLFDPAAERLKLQNAVIEEEAKAKYEQAKQAHAGTGRSFEDMKHPDKIAFHEDQARAAIASGDTAARNLALDALGNSKAIDVKGRGIQNLLNDSSLDQTARDDAQGYLSGAHYDTINTKAPDLIDPGALGKIGGEAVKDLDATRQDMWLKQAQKAQSNISYGVGTPGDKKTVETFRQQLNGLAGAKNVSIDLINKTKAVARSGIADNDAVEALFNTGGKSSIDPKTGKPV